MIKINKIIDGDTGINSSITLKRLKNGEVKGDFTAHVTTNHLGHMEANKVHKVTFHTLSYIVDLLVSDEDTCVLIKDKVVALHPKPSDITEAVLALINKSIYKSVCRNFNAPAILYIVDRDAGGVEVFRKEIPNYVFTDKDKTIFIPEFTVPYMIPYLNIPQLSAFINSILDLIAETVYEYVFKEADLLPPSDPDVVLVPDMIPNDEEPVEEPTDPETPTDEEPTNPDTDTGETTPPTDTTGGTTGNGGTTTDTGDTTTGEGTTPSTETPTTPTTGDTGSGTSGGTTGTTTDTGTSGTDTTSGETGATTTEPTTDTGTTTDAGTTDDTGTETSDTTSTTDTTGTDSTPTTNETEPVTEGIVEETTTTEETPVTP